MDRADVIEGWGEFRIIEVTDVDLAFPAKVRHYVPVKDDKQLCDSWKHSEWSRAFSRMFFGEASRQSEVVFLLPRVGIPGERAFRMVRAWMGSFEIKHEVKQAGAGFLLCRCFDSFAFIPAFGEYKAGSVVVGTSPSDENTLGEYRQVLMDMAREHKASSWHFSYPFTPEEEQQL